MHATRAHAGLVITDAVTGALLGNAGLAPGDDPEVGHVSYWVAAPAQGRGVATRAVRLLVDWAARCGMRQVRLWAKADNTGSRRVAERAGFRPDGTGQQTVRGERWDVVWYVR
jgi:RimJ/RimL family protein N-acetyltransferase